VAETALRQQAVFWLGGQSRQILSPAHGSRRRDLKVITLQIGKPQRVIDVPRTPRLAGLFDHRAIGGAEHPAASLFRHVHSVLR
jgi:hypothetical protein